MSNEVRELLELCLRCLHEDDFPHLRQQIRDALEENDSGVPIRT